MPKKPSSRWNKVVGYLAPPPKSTKKKGIVSISPRYRSSKPFLISKWSIVQLINIVMHVVLFLTLMTTNLNASPMFNNWKLSNLPHPRAQ